MNEVPDKIVNTCLWKAMRQHSPFEAALIGVRGIAEVVAAKIAEVLPGFTDHSIIHMDALWQVGDKVFTQEEIKRFTPSEAFVLVTSFYTHDLGMAVAATPEGRKELSQSSVYSATLERLLKNSTYEKQEAERISLQIAARELHADNAEGFVDRKIPGLDRYLLEDTELRNQWGRFIGQVAASHHWSLPDIEKILGNRGNVPDPIGNTIDLGFVACALRVIDFAHINAMRASSLERILRSEITPESLKHWRAQEYVTGPVRELNQLVYGSVRPIKDVDAWWTFYEMSSALDKEVISVAEYLAQRTVSIGRFSLEGVKGIRTPQSFAHYIQSDGFDPVDVRFRPDSIERLISILGGRQLYGEDYFAPIRELLQNARDAVLLRQATERLANHIPDPGNIRISIQIDSDGGLFSISDNGIGMTERIVTNYLLGIAADYWNSSDFFTDYPGVAQVGFDPVGRFGIGFLSVFMIGHDVEVETQRYGGQGLLLNLSGLGRRGSLKRQSSSAKWGTTIRVKVSRERLGEYINLAAIVRAKAPMISIPMEIIQGAEATVIRPNWWKVISQEELTKFLEDQRDVATTPRHQLEQKKRATAHPDHLDYKYYYFRTAIQLSKIPPFFKWIGKQPEIISDSYRVLAVPGSGHILLCSKGFAVNTVRVPGFIGIADIGEVELDAARSKALEWDEKAFRSRVAGELNPLILIALNNISKDSNIPARYRFLVRVAKEYGEELLIKTELPWVTIIEPPGDSSLISPESLKNRLATCQEVIVAYGAVNPWNIYSMSKELFPESQNDVPIIPVNSVDQKDVGSYEERVVIWQPLPEHINLQESPLLKATLYLISEATKIPLENLSQMKWCRSSRVLYGLLDLTK